MCLLSIISYNYKILNAIQIKYHTLRVHNFNFNYFTFIFQCKFAAKFLVLIVESLRELL